MAETREKKTETKEDEVRDMLNEISERRCSFIPERIAADEARDRLKAAFAEQACFLPGQAWTLASTFAKARRSRL